MLIDARKACWHSGSGDLWQQTHESLFLSLGVFENKGGQRQLVSDGIMLAVVSPGGIMHKYFSTD